MSDFSSRLKFAISNYAAGAISYKSFASLVDLPYRTLQNYLSGERSPNLEALEKLAKNGININWLITGKGTTYSVSELDKSLLDIVFILHSKDIIRLLFDKEKNLYDRRQKFRLLSFIMANNYLEISDFIHYVMDHDEKYENLEILEEALCSGEFEEFFDKTPTNQQELWKAKQVIKEKKSRNVVMPFKLDKHDFDEVGE